MPKKPGTAVIELRIEPNILADLLIYLESIGRKQYSRASIGRDSLELLHTILVDNEKIPSPVQTASEANEVFSSYGINYPSRAGRMDKALAESIRVERTIPNQKDLLDRARAILKGKS